MDKNLYALKKIEELRAENEALNRAFDWHSEATRGNFFKSNLDYRANATGGRRAELLKNPDYKAVLDKYK